MANIQYYDVILKPVVTEKSMNAMAARRNTHSLFTRSKQNPRSKKLWKKCSREQKLQRKHNELRRKEKKTRNGVTENS